MTLRLADITARIDGIRQLGAVVNAMRGIAAARAQQARGQLAAVDGYASVIAEGISHALTLMPRATDAPTKQANPALVVFAAEQGFAGTFSERVLDVVSPDLADSILFLVGTRGAAVLAERSITPDWTGALPSHSAGVPKLADQITEALYARIAKGEVTKLSVVYARSQPGHPIDVFRDELLPLDASKFSSPDQAQPSLFYLSPDVLLSGLTADYLHAQLCHAALHAFAAENEARMAAMAAARDQIGRQLATLCGKERQVRQDEITAEVIELAAGAGAARA